ncbi:RagB/SusD family nutrient uptake outer membrane protein [Echinicola vietnamensis]|uniref:RagB/SusD family protein n=1 Tax=Echinicola vietnamensis (strain DSM 17526 / LMG 23754 / KMM 6221) TaxID=926556 RepID=L0G020_ECHVK|nr:RagB/SusD family nutrient uptake outer membrane protein [Echinicola vietnamensis]AGA78225.1 RagB/SusD family protein [Echinicola vietnamensis DSM 17526]
MKKLISTLFIIFIFFSCQDDWLEEKRSLSLVVPSTLKDMRLLLNNSFLFTNDGLSFCDISADDYYITDEVFAAAPTAIQRNLYLWEKDIYQGRTDIEDWNTAYEQIFTANVILDGLARINPSESQQNEYNSIKGGALFFRGKAMFCLAQEFAGAYIPEKANSQPGIPIRLSPDIDAPVSRSTLQQTYDQIVSDLSIATDLLGDIPESKTDASKPAALGWLARSFLSMGNYDKALECTERYLDITNLLMDYNDLDQERRYPFSLFNDEVISHSVVTSIYQIGFRPRALVKEQIFESYKEGDLRKDLFFIINEDGTVGFRGHYTGQNRYFTGIATDEMYLIKSECQIRTGNVQDGLKSLNTLLKTRYVTGQYENKENLSQKEALDFVLRERRKELLFRGLRWMDLRRLNLDPEYAVTLTREIEGMIYKLEPGDKRYVFPIPENVIASSGMEQNPR